MLMLGIMCLNYTRTQWASSCKIPVKELVNLSSIQTDTLFYKSDVVVCGTIKNILGGFFHDMGTEYVMIELEPETIYKQNIHLAEKSIHFTAIVSNLNYKNYSDEYSFSKFKGKKCIYYLSKDHFNPGSPLPDSCIKTLTEEEHLNALMQAEKEKRIVNLYNTTKLCQANCNFCAHIAAGKWNAVKRYIDIHCNDRNEPSLNTHRRVKWVNADRVFLASMPSQMGIRYCFITDSGEVHCEAGFQIGYVYPMRSRLNYLSQGLLRLPLNKIMRTEVYDTLILKSFTTHINAWDYYFKFQRDNFCRMLTDSAKLSRYGPNVKPPDELIMLADIYDYDFRFYIDHQTMDDYDAFAKSYVEELKREKKVYHLCLMSMHTVTKFGQYSLRALRELSDARCIPFLIYLAQHRNFVYTSSDEAVEEQMQFLDELSNTLDALTGFDSAFNLYSDHIFDFEKSIPQWNKKYRMN